MKLTQEQIKELNSQVYFLGLYTPGISIQNAMPQIEYLAELLEEDENVVKAVFAYIDWPDSDVANNGGAAIFFTNKRVMLGYRYAFRGQEIKTFHDFAYSEFGFIKVDNENNPIVLELKKGGTITFSILNKSSIGKKGLEDYYCSSPSLRRRILSLQIKDLIDHAPEEWKDNEQFLQIKEFYERNNALLDKINDFHKGLCYCVANLGQLGGDAINSIMMDGYKVYCEKNGLDLPNPPYYVEI